MSLHTRRLSYTLGAEIIGVDLRRPLADKAFGEIHAAYLDYSMLLFRGQSLTPEQHIAFGRQFGELDKNEDFPLEDRTPGFPEIQIRAKGAMRGSNARHWHTDRAFRRIPASATVLYAVDLPELGGDTMFANMYAAFEALSDGMKSLVQNLVALHPGLGYVIDGETWRTNENGSPERVLESKRRNPTVTHPLVRNHPQTGRKALYLSEKVKQFAGMTEEESMPLIRFLVEHATRPQFVYRHQWKTHDLLMWDNRCTMHKAVGDYDMTRRRQLDKIGVMETQTECHA